MLPNFFQTGPLPANQMLGSYDPKLVILSFLVAILASYIALDITGRLRDKGNTSASRTLWLTGGSIAMGAGIWSMHFIGMLSFDMPMITMHYDPLITGLSLGVAIAASAFALFLLKTKVINAFHLGLGGVVLGLGIASMHYTGMEAMKNDMNIHYLPGLFAVSILIAIAASEAALWLALKSNQVVSRLRIRLKMISAIIMGIAICGMHYTGMAAAVFTPTVSTTNTGSLDQTFLAVSIACITFIILAVAFFASTYKETQNQHQLEKARQLGMAEVAASVLHNVGNVLNSVNVSTNLVAEKLASSKLKGLDDLSEMIKNHKDDLATFITQDPRGSKIPNYINLLADYRKEEQDIIAIELQVLMKNLEHIKNIISIQQGLIIDKCLEEIISVKTTLDEALLIVDISLERHKIKVNKQYDKISFILCDKVKLLQILVNLLTNAKDALKATLNENKLLTLKLTRNDKKVIIQITDNGIGILPKDMSKIFIYGFTTKHEGHGFGLHSSILAAKEMGGDIRITSDGLGCGATFTLELPYKLPNK